MRPQGALVVAIVSQPFKLEGRRRMACARIAAAALRREADMLIVVQNERLLDLVPPGGHPSSVAHVST